MKYLAMVLDKTFRPTSNGSAHGCWVQRELYIVCLPTWGSQERCTGNSSKASCGRWPYTGPPYEDSLTVRPITSMRQAQRKWLSQRLGNTVQCLSKELYLPGRRHGASRPGFSRRYIVTARRLWLGETLRRAKQSKSVRRSCKSKP